jgi:hypothetical protein
MERFGFGLCQNPGLPERPGIRKPFGQGLPGIAGISGFFFIPIPPISYNQFMTLPLSLLLPAAISSLGKKIKNLQSFLAIRNS